MSGWSTELHWLRPWAFWLVSVIGLCWWWIRRKSDPTTQLQKAIAPHLLTHLVITSTAASRWNPANVLLLTWMFSVLAIAGPTWKRKPSPLADDRAQLMIVIKITDSMMSKDVPPSRLERARSKLADLLALRRGSETGLIAYSGSAHLVMPPTKDMDIINQMIQALEPSIMPTEGEALEDAIQMAADQLLSSKVGGSILVVTDSAPLMSLDWKSKLTTQSPRAGNGTSSFDLNAISKTSSEKLDIPIQFLAMVRSDEALEASGIVAAADVLDARVQQLTIDDRDVNALVSRADRIFADIVQSDETMWQDAGFVFVPVIALTGLLWSRRGWNLRT
ncbi:MAG: VWA domain-containing protein [Planctomycetota bacterium]